MIGINITRTLYDTKRAGEIIQSLIDAGFTKIVFEICDGSSIGQPDHIYIEASSCDWKNSEKEKKEC